MALAKDYASVMSRKGEIMKKAQIGRASCRERV